MRTHFYALLTLGLILVGFQHSHAQLRYGIKGGTNLTVITKGGNFYESVKPAPGYQFGGYVKLFPNSPVRLQAEAMYIQNEFNSMFTSDTVQNAGGQSLYAKTIELKQQNAYINIPVMMYIKVFKKLDISVGPQIALITKAVATGQQIYNNLQTNQDSMVNVAWNYLKDQAGQGAYANDSTLDQGKFFNPAVLDVNLGASLNLTKALKVELRTNYGLMSAINDYYKAGFDIKKINRTFGAQLNLALEFGGGKKD